MSLSPVPLSAMVLGARPTRVRYMVLGFVVAAYFITYLDRVLLSASVNSIRGEFGFSKITMGWVLFAYQIAYAAFQIPGGWLGDRLGPRIAMAGVVIWWSTFTALNALTWSATSMAICLFLIGMGEAGAFPIANRALSRWMLPAERGFAQGVTHAGSRLGGAVTPVMVAALITAYSWRAPFVIFAGVGIVWALCWYRFYRNTPAEHALVNESERETITAALGAFATGRRRVPWAQILSNPQTWLLSAMYFCYGYDIGVFLTWFPNYLKEVHHFNLQQMGIYASLPLFAGLIGDILGGLTSDLILKRTGNVKFARRIVSLVGFGLASAAVTLAAATTDPTISIAWFCLAVFGLELTVGVSWAVTLDVGGEFAGSVSAVMNTLGNVGAAIAVAITAHVLWGTAFGIIAGFALAAALLCLTVDASRRLYAVEPATE